VELLAQPLKLRLTRDESDPSMSDYGRYSVYSVYSVYYSLYWYKKVQILTQNAAATLCSSSRWQPFTQCTIFWYSVYSLYWCKKYKF
jgi:hypothetical protein